MRRNEGNRYWYECDSCHKRSVSWALGDVGVEAFAWDLASNGWQRDDVDRHVCGECAMLQARQMPEWMKRKPEPNFISLAREWLGRVNDSTSERINAVAVKLDSAVIVGWLDGFEEIAASASYTDAACVLRSLENELAKSEAIRAAEAEVATAEKALHSAKQRLDKARAMEGR